MSVSHALRRLTLTQQWLLATLLAVLPLLLAVSYAMWSLAEQTQQHRRLLLANNQVKELEALVTQQVGGLERAHLQYLSSNDSRFLDVYDERLTNLQDYTRQLREALTPGTELAIVEQLVRQVSAIENYGTNAGAVDQAFIDKVWESIRATRLEFSHQVSTLTQESIATSEASYQAISQRLVLIVALTIPGTVLLVILSTVALARPWWRLVNTIRRLGEQDWHAPVVIEGPADFVELGKNLEWMREQLLAIERQKQAFSQHVTHELKSPLAAIVEAESLLRDELPGTLNRDQIKVLDILRTNAANLSDLIQQLLNYNTVLHNLRPAAEVINVQAVYQKIRQQLEVANPNQKIAWRWRDNNRPVISDIFCVRMILNNLMSNACKAVPASGIIFVSSHAEEHYWTVTVEDNGPGIKVEEREKVFKPFYQGKYIKRGSLVGSGIGLSIVRECVEKLGGDITVDTSSLGGACMAARVPQQQLLEVDNVTADYSIS